jgi:hypothetical protein
MEFMEYATLAVTVIGTFIIVVVVWRRRDRKSLINAVTGPVSG